MFLFFSAFCILGVVLCESIDIEPLAASSQRTERVCKMEVGCERLLYMARLCCVAYSKITKPRCFAMQSPSEESKRATQDGREVDEENDFIAWSSSLQQPAKENPPNQPKKGKKAVIISCDAFINTVEPFLQPQSTVPPVTKISTSLNSSDGAESSRLGGRSS